MWRVKSSYGENEWKWKYILIKKSSTFAVNSTIINCMSVAGRDTNMSKSASRFHRTCNSKTHLERGKCIWCNIEGRHLNILEKVIEFLRIQHDLRERLIACTFAQHRAAVERNLLMLIARHQRKEDLRLCADMLDGGRSCADLSSKYIVEYLRHILLALEVDTAQILDE